MSKFLSEWEPSGPALELIKLNGVPSEQISATLDYLRSRSDMENIDDVEGYDDWNAFFIMFCIKANSVNSG